MEISEPQPILVFYSYDENDRDLLDLLDKHLATLKHQQLIKGWHNRDISAGTDWKSAINEYLNNAQVILLLISADFIASDYLYSVEMKHALKRHNSGNAFVIPVLLRPCDIAGTLFNQLDFLPGNKRAITLWFNIDEAFREVAEGIGKVVKEFLPRTKEQWLDEGSNYHRAKLYEKALVAYERALRLDASYVRALRNKGDALYDLKRYAEALSIYTITLHLEPSSAAYTYRYIASVLWNLGRHDEALDAYNHSIELAPTAHLYNEKGDTLFRLKRYEEALLAYQQAVKLDPTFAYAYHNIGNVLLRLKCYRDAISAYERAIHLDPTLVHPHNNRGRALFHLGYYLESLTAYKRAIQLDSTIAAVYANLAETLEKLDQTQEAAVARAKAYALKNKKEQP